MTLSIFHTVLRLRRWQSGRKLFQGATSIWPNPPKAACRRPIHSTSSNPGMSHGTGKRPSDSFPIPLAWLLRGSSDPASPSGRQRESKLLPVSCGSVDAGSAQTEARLRAKLDWTVGAYAGQKASDALDCPVTLTNTTSVRLG